MQLTGDTTCFVKDKSSLCHLLDIFKQFQCCVGLKMNTDKNKAKILGPELMPPDGLCGLDWTEDAVNTHVVLSGNETNHQILDYKKILKTMKNLWSSWKCRYLYLKRESDWSNPWQITVIVFGERNSCPVPSNPRSETNRNRFRLERQRVKDCLWCHDTTYWERGLETRK